MPSEQEINYLDCFSFLFDWDFARDPTEGKASLLGESTTESDRERI